MRLPSAIERIDRLMSSCAACGADLHRGRDRGQRRQQHVQAEGADRADDRGACDQPPGSVACLQAGILQRARPAAATDRRSAQLVESRRPARPAHDAGLLPDPRRPDPRERPVRDGRAFAVFRRARRACEQLAKEGSRGARAALRLLDDPTRFLSTVQFYITLIGVLAGVYSGARFAEPLAAWLARLRRARAGRALPRHDRLRPSSWSASPSCRSSIGELVPKRWALTNPEAIASRLAPLDGGARDRQQALRLGAAGLDRAGRARARHPHDDEPRRERGGDPLDDRRGDAHRHLPRRRAPDDRGRPAPAGPHGAQHHDPARRRRLARRRATAARRCGTPCAPAATRATRSAAASSTSWSAS